MFFDVKANLAEVLKQEATPATRATSATKRANVASVADVAGGHPEIQKTEIPPKAPDPAPKPSRQEREQYPYGLSAGGRPLTSTGKVVSFEAWKRLSNWEKHGSKGKVFNALPGQWEYPA